ncbi:MAG: HAMP domain-containing protein [Desulfatibacillaceae bacterium]|nr:HAMP domain-containing protein [Desulfatibacillaceae bacterium]
MADKKQISCESCGKTHEMDSADLLGKKAVPCPECQKDIILADSPGSGQALEPPSRDAAGERPARRARPQAVETEGQKRLLGLRGKMAILFLLIPILLMIVAGGFYLWQLGRMVSVFSDSSSEIVNRLTGDLNSQYSRQVALQVKQHLDDNPFLRRDNFNTNHDFKLLAVQKVGMTGYTAIYSAPEFDDSWRIWAHVDPEVIGVDMRDLKSKYGAGFDDFWSIVTGVADGSSSSGTYAWTDKDGVEHSNYVVATPVEDTSYVVMAVTPTAEFLRDVKRLETRTGKVASRTRLIIGLILGITILLIGAIVAFYGAQITGKLRSLTEAADRISTGEMDAEIDVKSDDEIGDLAAAIGRMQDSIRISIERLRRRRNK